MAVVCSDGAALGLLRPRPGRLAAHLRHPHAWVTAAGSDRALAELAGAALWVAAAWLAVGLAAGLAAWLPGPAGRCAGRIGRALLPRALRGLIAGSAGLGILLAPVAGAATTPAGPAGPTGPGSSGAPASHASSIPAPAWPVSPADGVSGEPSRPPAPPTTSVPAPVWPSSAGPTPTTPLTSTDQPAPTPGPQVPASTSTAQARRVRVEPGDCLWLIASRRLGPGASAAQVSAEWPRWYAANESVIGADPDVIRPGEVLHPPSAGT
ncbi:MAG: LysM peptidoglycan-binding domain-containing protein [Jatrophihabitans sp.]|uniref:LysM peptidoglycan-binding domain-containing protein n=1 Tax=Jatrophihabitans sp. TaxID=1932789 RepID=UPI00390D2E2A